MLWHLHFSPPCCSASGLLLHPYQSPRMSSFLFDYSHFPGPQTETFLAVATGFPLFLKAAKWVGSHGHHPPSWMVVSFLLHFFQPSTGTIICLHKEEVTERHRGAGSHSVVPGSGKRQTSPFPVLTWSRIEAPAVVLCNFSSLGCSGPPLP